MPGDPTSNPDWEFIKRLSNPQLVALKQKQLHVPAFAKLLRYFAWVSLVFAVLGGLVLGRANFGFGVSVIAKGVAGWLVLLALEALIVNIISIRELLEALVWYARQE